MFRKLARLAFVASFLLVTTHRDAIAQEAPGEEGGPPGGGKSYLLGLGIAGLSQQRSYAGVERDDIALPMVYFENGWLQVAGPGLEFKMPGLEWGESQELSFGARIEFDGSGYDPDDAPILAGMEKRKMGILAGVAVKWKNPFADVYAAFLVDALGNSDGQRASLGLERSFQAGKHFMLTPALTATWLDEKYVDYYYGVRAEEARPGRPAYAAEATLNLAASLRLDYLWSEKQSVFVALEYTQVGDEIEESPLTDTDYETTIFTGYLFRF